MKYMYVFYILKKRRHDFFFLQWFAESDYTTFALFKNLDRQLVHSQMYKSVSYYLSLLESVFWFAGIQVNM